MARSAIIVGAGIGGLSAAIALARVGVKAQVFEKTTELKATGAGIILYPNALNVLRRLDALDDVARNACFASHGRYTNPSGKTLAEFDLKSAGLAHGLIAIHRGDLQHALAAKVGMEAIRLGASCQSFEQSDEGISARFSDGSLMKADMLIGADGLHSVIREMLLHDGPPRYSGSFAWRGVASVPTSVLPDDSGFMCFGRGLQFGAARIGKGRVYWFGAVADPEGVKQRTSKHDVTMAFRGWHEPIQQLIAATPEEEILAHDLFDRDPSPVWGQGRVTLLGDAAHPMTPYMGQGGCQALEDSIALAAALNSHTDIANALRQYESMRRDRTSEFVLQSRKSQAVSMTNSAILSWLRDMVFPILPKRVVLEQFHTLENHHVPDIN